MEQATVTSQVSIDIGPDGIKFSFEGMDNDLAELINQAKEFEVVDKEFYTNDTSSLAIRSKKKIAFVDRPAEDTTNPVDNTTDTV